MSFAYYIASDKIGEQDSKLGAILMQSFFNKLIEAGELPAYILLVERGVRLLLAEFPAFEALRALEDKGVEILACATCLEFYDIKDKIIAGKISNMPSIIEIMHKVEKVIRL
ncbi:MAG TPA: sulfurtransferase-like selenium metabolism protein YedF [Desulfitobacteriaceae bacterium]|jgi:selenium metabolism protein YedF|nr:sulfurtransferase-like selenium metabolism protein YedF [Desulfitobacteriaceae bacterium]